MAKKEAEAEANLRKAKASRKEHNGRPLIFVKTTTQTHPVSIFVLALFDLYISTRTSSPSFYIHSDEILVRLNHVRHFKHTHNPAILFFAPITAQNRPFPKFSPVSRPKQAKSMPVCRFVHGRGICGRGHGRGELVRGS